MHEKVKSVDLKKLRKLDKGLHEYASFVIAEALKRNAPGAHTVSLDKQFLPLFAEMENQRNPGLNLHVFRSFDACVQGIRDKQREVARNGQGMEMRILYPPFVGAPDHYVALDVRFRPGHRPSAIFFESALGHMMGSAQGKLMQALGGARVNVVPNLIQNSEWDCVMFALNNALKSFKTHAEFSGRIHDNPAIAEQLGIPPDFLKHMHSKTVAEDSAHANSIVNKEKTGQNPETLLQRVSAYRADRFDRQYSTSIEGFRFQEIQRAGEYLAAKQPKKKSFFGR